MTAMAVAVAVMPVSAASRPARLLAAELLIVRGDLARLADPSLPPANREGLRQRVAGALGLLPWLLRETGDAAGADRLRAWQSRSFADTAGRAALTADIETAIARHPIDRGAFLEPPPTPERLREARTIHQAFCAGCHDGAGAGASDAPLPARDLFTMARQEPADEFLARLVNGVKGDEMIHFANPLTDAQIGALWTFYRNSTP